MLNTAASNSELTQELNTKQIKIQNAINAIPISKALIYRILSNYFNRFNETKNMLNLLQEVVDNAEINENIKDEQSALTYIIQGLDYMERGRKQFLKY